MIASLLFYVQISHYAVHTELEATPYRLGLYSDISERPKGSNHTDEAYGAMTEDLEFNVYIAEPTLSIDDSQLFEISTYPNPTRGQLTITA